MKHQFDLLVILGPTASGKTRLAAQLANLLNGEVVSADSRQVYRGLEIGSGMDLNDYLIEGRRIQTHMIGNIDPAFSYNVERYRIDVQNVFDDLHNRHILPILCGGSGLYLEAALGNLTYTGIPVDEELRSRLLLKTKEELLSIFQTYAGVSYHQLADVSTIKRLIRAIEICAFLTENPTYKQALIQRRMPFIIGLDPEKAVRWTRIEKRLKQRIEAGLIEEVEKLLEEIGEVKVKRFGLEYLFTSMYIKGELTKLDFENALLISIRQFSKRQMTFFRKMEKAGLPIRWIKGNYTDEDLFDISQSLLKDVSFAP